ncbi:MAG: glycosyltransferase family 2 protein [Patescibacteria group bacterium]
MNSYLTAARAQDIENPRERLVYRLFEMLPGFLAWSTLGAAVFGAWRFPVATAFFILGFTVFWLLRVLYFAFHLRAGYQKMQEHEKINWLQKLTELSPKNYSLPLSGWQDIYHLILVPTYKEPWEILRETLGALKNSTYPKKTMIVVLGIEEKEGNRAQQKAALLAEEFQKEFFRFVVTLHPIHIPGEIAGKGANETWAAKRAKEQVVDPLHIPHERIIVTSLDADTVVSPQYLSCLTYHYLTSKAPLRHSYQPVPLFINNVWQASGLSRIFAFSTTFWYLLNQERPETLSTFSSHSMSFRTLVEVGFKQTNFVSDDSRIFWQCFLRYDGEYAVQPLYYPVSMDANAAPTFWGTVKNIYLQQRRWAYGVADIPYFLFGFLKRKIPLRKKLSLGFDRIEAFWSWATASPLMFVLGWLPIVLGGTEFSQTLLSYNLPRYTSWILTVTLLGLVWSVYLTLLFLPPRPPEYKKWKLFWFVVQWIFLPPIMIFFSLPAIDAQTRLMLGKYLGFWSTPKFRKK